MQAEWAITLSVVSLVVSVGSLVTTLGVLHNMRETLKLLTAWQRQYAAMMEAEKKVELATK